MNNNPLRWASTLIASFCDSGVSHAIISPGSRSTPLTVAAAIQPGLKKKVVLDERSAAYIALGVGKATGTPAILICTSGTAAANYLPAVIEAKHSGVPMVLLSADRPPLLRNLGSPQTIDQVKLFGDHAVFFHEAGEPLSSESDLKRIRYLARQSVATSIRKGGAAHINLPFRKPLEPTEEQLSAEIERIRNRQYISGTPDSTTSSIRPDRGVIHHLSLTKKPLILAGPANPHHALAQQVQHLSSRLHAPVIAEPGSHIPGSTNMIFHYDQFLRNKTSRADLKPDLLIRFGDQPFTKSLLTILEEWADLPLIHITSRDSWQDHSMSVNDTLYCRPGDQLDLEGVPETTDTEWIRQWKHPDRKCRDTLYRLIGQTDVLTDGHIFNFMTNTLSESWVVMLSNSFPARDMALFGKNAPGQFVNRGAAGIDGITSTAAGLQLALQQPLCCLTGDLAFLHDATALYSLRDLSLPFVIIVINNGGGTIFRMLPVYQSLKSVGLYQTYFETPQNTDILSLAKASGISYRKIEHPDQLEALNVQSFSGATVVECITDPEASMNLRNQLWTE